jgi:hypothetical protein
LTALGFSGLYGILFKPLDKIPYLFAIVLQEYYLARQL